MAIVTYKHEKGSCDFTAEMEVKHRKLILFICPRCLWTSAFIPTENYDATGDFEHSKFTPVDASLFNIKPKGKKKGGRKTSTNKSSTRRTAKPKPFKLVTGTSVLYASKSLKETLKNKTFDKE